MRAEDVVHVLRHPGQGVRRECWGPVYLTRGNKGLVLVYGDRTYNTRIALWDVLDGDDWEIVDADGKAIGAPNQFQKGWSMGRAWGAMDLIEILNSQGVDAARKYAEKACVSLVQVENQ